MKRNVLSAILAWVTLLPVTASAAHGVAYFGTPKYPADFRHFDYVNPDAKRGGTLNLSIVSQNSSFDKFNPFSLKGKPAPGLVELMFETLTVLSFDEPNTHYGLLAEDISVASDFGSVEFRLNPKARFSNGDPVTAEDVEYSFSVLTSKQASPRFRSYFSEVKAVTVTGPLSVRFEFKRKGRDLSFIAGSLPVFSPKWGLRPDGTRVGFDALRLEAPIASGPYVIEQALSGRDVVYRKNPDYWGADIPVRRGMYNFERVVYKLYKDADTQVAALRAGEFDFFSETRMRYWCCQFIGKRFDSGELKKELFSHQNPPAMNGYVVNLRKPRFQDVRVRMALNYAHDFEWVNQKIFDDEFERVTSYFSNTPLAAKGLPSAEELELLEPYRGEIPGAVFGPMFEQPSTRPPSSLRANLTRALELLAEAGWHNQDGVLRNAAGEPFEMEVTGARKQNPYLDAYFLNLSKLGVVIKKRLSDAATTRQVMNQFDFDFASIALREARMPGAELWRNFNSKDADVPGSENIAGVKSRAVDELIQRLLDADTRAELEVTARALDRVLIHSHYVVPWRYLTKHYFIYHERLGRPSTVPLYYGAYDWVIGTWWDAGATTGEAGLDRAAASSIGGWPVYAGGALLGAIVLAAGRRSRRTRVEREADSRRRPQGDDALGVRAGE
jgi:microcin C transport system substrate-binding protein